MFVDHIKIHVKAGDGGNGSAHFRRAKGLPKGGPDGGDGGSGGDVILRVDSQVNHLKDFFYRSKFNGEAGVHGMGQKKTGKSGKPLILRVPPGTLVYRSPDPNQIEEKTDYEFLAEISEGDLPEISEDDDLVEDQGEMVEMSREEETFLEDEELDDPEEIDEVPEDEEQDDPEEIDDVPEDDANGEFLIDLTEEGQEFVLCDGGGGGKGNWHFRSSTNQAPLEYTPGGIGEEGWFYLELRQIADVGMVGFPNAGKSTLVRALSNATPKVAAYPFTTLKPLIGVMDFPGFYRATVADIPGLIEGAHANVGLGHDFLRHISRCRLFLFVADTAAVDQRDPVGDIEKLRTELSVYDSDLSERQWLIVANKMDLEDSELFIDELKERFPKQEIFPISATNGEGVKALKDRLRELVGKRPV